jgi:hypothetical protein
MLFAVIDLKLVELRGTPFASYHPVLKEGGGEPWMAILRKRLQMDFALYTILQILSSTLFEKTPILQVLTAELTELK